MNRGLKVTISRCIISFDCVTIHSPMNRGLKVDQRDTEIEDMRELQSIPR